MESVLSDLDARAGRLSGVYQAIGLDEGMALSGTLSGMAADGTDTMGALRGADSRAGALDALGNLDDLQQRLAGALRQADSCCELR